MRKIKERDYEPIAAVWILILSFLGVSALVSIGISALVIKATPRNPLQNRAKRDIIKV